MTVLVKITHKENQGILKTKRKFFSQNILWNWSKSKGLGKFKEGDQYGENRTGRATLGRM